MRNVWKQDSTALDTVNEGAEFSLAPLQSLTWGSRVGRHAGACEECEKHVM